jgi:prepilin-type N-terminal cleavage/methylation domain-containing protein
MFISRALDLRRRRHRSGFTLIEIIGVLALIAVLAALLIPKIFEAIHNARLRQTVIEVQTMRTAVTEHYGRYGSLASSNGVALTITTELTNFDRVLLNEAIIDKPFRSRLATNAFVRLVSTSGFTSSTSIDRENGAYDLDGNGANDVIGAYAVDAVLVGITEEDAVALNNVIDGAALGVNPGGNDTKGRVRYHRAGNNGNGNGNGNGNTDLRVQVYISHR